MMRRYQTETLKQNNMRKMIKPTHVLHINNIPADKCTNDIKAYLNNFGLNVVNCLGIAVKTKVIAFPNAWIVGLLFGHTVLQLFRPLL